MSRRNRKNSRRSNRKTSRKSYRRNNMNSMNFMNMMGGKYDPMEISLDQGSEYLDSHKNQHGGGALSGAPVDYEMRLDPALVPSSRTAPLDAAIQEIQGMSDFASSAPSTQAGGRRRRRSRKSRKASRKSRKASRKSRKASKKSRKVSRKNRKGSRRMYGGALALASAPINSPNMLLSTSQAAKAGTADFSNPLLKY